MHQVVELGKPNTCYGCAGKLTKSKLAKVVSRLPLIPDDRLIGGVATFDDASVFKVNETLGLVSTVDVMDPIGEDYYHFGRVAAVNSLSDIYAMGGEPLVVLNVVCTQAAEGELEKLYQTLKGVQEVVLEAGAVVGGGHTTVAERFKFGLAVTGQIHPDQVVFNDGAKPGDQLILTKPLGATSILSGMLPIQPDHEAVHRAFAVMETLNREAASAMVEVQVHACTDVTGFGLIGHLFQMMEQSGVTAHIRTCQLPILEAAIPFANLPSQARTNNMTSFEDGVQIRSGVDSALIHLAYEANTSGGLLIAVGSKKTQALLSSLEKRNVPAAWIGEVTEAQDNTKIVLHP